MHLSVNDDVMRVGVQMQKVGRGEMLVSLCYTPAVNRLTVVVLKARNLPRMDVSGCSGAL